MDNCNKCLYQPICNAYAALGVADVPASDVTPCELFRNKESIAEVVHGEWICLEAEIGFHCCSLCGHKILRAKCNYCPNCGAKMDVGGESYAKSEN